MKVKSLSRVRLFATPWTVAYQAPPSMGFSRQEFWSGLPFPSPRDLPNPGIEPGSPAWVPRGCLQLKERIAIDMVALPQVTGGLPQKAALYQTSPPSTPAQGLWSMGPGSEMTA